MNQANVVLVPDLTTCVTDDDGPVLSYGPLSVCCSLGNVSNVSMVHACKTPCHDYAVATFGHLIPKSERHLSCEIENNLFLNMIDARTPDKFSIDMFNAAMDFMWRSFEDKRHIVVHCNQGASRSPMLCMLFMAKRLRLFRESDCLQTMLDFGKQFLFDPSDGIVRFVGGAWKHIR